MSEMNPDRRRLSRAESDRLLDLGTGADPLAALLASAAASQHDEPVPGEQEALAHFRAIRAARAAKEAVAARTTRGAYVARAQAPAPRLRRHGLKVALSAFGLMLTGGVAVAATGSLPASLQHAAHRAFGAPEVKSHKSVAETSVTSSVTTAAVVTARRSPSVNRTVTPSATPSASLTGLCVAYRAGVIANPKVLEDPAFAALVVAAGGLERVANFCNTLVPLATSSTSAHPGPPSHPARTPKKPKPPG